MRKHLLLTAFALLASAFAFAQTTTIEKATEGMTKQDGYLPFYYDAKKGKIWLEISRLDVELLYYPTLAQGVGSNDIGLDRGRLGSEHIVKFQRSGPKILMVEPNYAYRALSDDPLERKAVEESFAQSVLWGFEVGAETGNRSTCRPDALSNAGCRECLAGDQPHEARKFQNGRFALGLFHGSYQEFS